MRVHAICLVAALMLVESANAAVTLIVDDAGGSSSSSARVRVRLETDEQVAGVQNDLSFSVGAPIAAKPNGRPACEANPEINKDATAFAYLPTFCTVGATCTGIRALVLSLSNVDPIPTGSTLYTCDVATLNPGFEQTYPIDCPAALASDPQGSELATECVGGSVTVGCSQSPALLAFDFTVDPPQPRVGDRVLLTVQMTNITGGLVGLPEYTLNGAAPFLTGDTSTRTDSLGPTSQTYELEAAQAGTAAITMRVRFETSDGCRFFFRINTSAPFEVVIAPAPASPTPSTTPSPTPTMRPPASGKDDGCNVVGSSTGTPGWLALGLLAMIIRRGVLSRARAAT